MDKSKVYTRLATSNMIELLEAACLKIFATKKEMSKLAERIKKLEDK